MVEETHNLAVTEKTNITEYFQEYALLLKEELGLISKCDNITGISLNPEEVEELEDNCSLEGLHLADELVPSTSIRDVKEAMRSSTNFKIPTDQVINLATLKCKEKWANYVANGEETFTIPIEPETIKEEEADLIKLQGIVIIVKMFSPSPVLAKCGRRFVFKSSHSIAILPDQTLADLRDKFFCTCDIGFMHEIETPVETKTLLAKEMYPSGFIFIENCFYNDMRHKNSVDNSEVIRNWPAKKTENYTTARMEDTKISDLRVRFGYPYLYQHQGDCEHVITFHDARLLNNNDHLSLSCYPYNCFHNHFQSRLCYICGVNVSRFYVTDCEKLPHKYNFLCETCLTSYCYLDGKKIGTFKLYPYYDKSSILLNL